MDLPLFSPLDPVLDEGIIDGSYEGCEQNDQDVIRDLKGVSQPGQEEKTRRSGDHNSQNIFGYRVPGEDDQEAKRIKRNRSEACNEERNKRSFIEKMNDFTDDLFLPDVLDKF
jgi:hypothetical protein